MSATAKMAPAKVYHRQMPVDWWLKNPRYVLFMVREISSVFVALFVVLHLLYFMMMGAGGGADQSALEIWKSPVMIGLHVVILLFALLHTVTWLALTGRIQVVRLGERVISPAMVTAGAFAGWLVVSAALAAFLILRAG